MTLPEKTVFEDSRNFSLIFSVTIAKIPRCFIKIAEFWTTNAINQRTFEIKTAKSDIEKLTAEASKADSDVAQLSSAIAKLEEELAKKMANTY